MSYEKIKQIFIEEGAQRERLRAQLRGGEFGSAIENPVPGVVLAGEIGIHAYYALGIARQLARVAIREQEPKLPTRSPRNASLD